jgi:type IV pilus assembly protein PilE
MGMLSICLHIDNLSVEINDSDVIERSELKHRLSGFTLVELLIAIAILGILYSLAMPSYTRYIQESRRSDVQQALIQQAATLERIYTRQGGYPKDFPVAANDFYQFTYSPADEFDGTHYRKYSLSAAPKSGSAQSGDRCGTLTVNHAGTFGASLNDCW